MLYTKKWTWSNELPLIEEDIIVSATWSLMALNTPTLLAITDVKALIREKGQRVEKEFDTVWKNLCLASLQNDEALFSSWASEIQEDLVQSAEDAIADSKREQRED